MNVDLPADCDPRFRRLADYLEAKAPPGKLPGRQHINPAEIPDLLPHVTLLEVVAAPPAAPRYRFRLVGSEVAAMQGTDRTGQFIDEILVSAAGMAIIRGYHEMLRTKRPRYLTGFFASDSRQHVAFQRCAFPLARNGEEVDMLLIMFVRRSIERA